MFLSEQATVPVAFPAVAARLDNLAGGGALKSASQAAFAEATARLRRAGRLAGGSQLVQAEFGSLRLQQSSAVIALRWEAPGPGGSRYSALDAEITVSPEGQDETVVRLAGEYEPPPDLPDRRAARKVATVTSRDFVGRVAGLVAEQEPGRWR
jgi:hypothetical protein